MAVFRVERTQGYTVMSNYHLRDKSLSLKAKGLLSQMLSLPEDWDYTTKGLACICKDGVDSITSAMNLPGASPQVLCSAPTSPLTVLAFYICLRICKSGVSGIPCLNHYTKSEKLSCPSTISP